MRINTPEHLGRTGDNNFSGIDIPVLDYFCNRLPTDQPRKFLDIGCANGDVVLHMKNLGLESYGIDGDPYAIYEYSDPSIRDNLFHHDYTEGQSIFDRKVDIVWSMDFVRHVEEIYFGNYIKDFLLGRTIILNTAPVGTLGHHVVNDKSKDYWISAFENYDYTYSRDDSLIASELSEYHNPVHSDLIESLSIKYNENYMIFHAP
jgi:SAM-dependent methyltransferase